MNVLLVAPTALDSRGHPVKKRRIYLPGLTLPLLAALISQDVDLRLVLETAEEVPFDEPWDLVGLTGMGSGIIRAWQIADEFRRRGVPVVLGGIATGLGTPEWSLEHVDSVVLGEAEDLWPQIVEDFSAGRMQPVYRMEHRPALDALPVPRYDLLNPAAVGLWLPVQATRGCPFTCSFCSVTAYFGQSYRKRPVEHVVRDVRAASQTRSPYIAFIDDNIGVDWDYCTRLWEALIPERIIWMCQCSLEIAERPGMLELAHRSGCRMLSFGLESTNCASLESIGKGWNRPERYDEAIRTIRRHGIDVSTEMIIGLDADGPSVFQETYSFIMRNRISVPRVHILTPVPGTPMYDRLEQDGRLLTRDFGRYTGGRVVYRPLNIGVEDLQAGYWHIYDKLFSWPGILQRAGSNPANLGPFMRAVVLGANLSYRQHIRRRITPGIV